MSGGTIHVVPANGRWAVQIQGEKACVSEHRIQVVAIMHGRELAKARRADFVVHARDGRIRRTTHFAGGSEGISRWLTGEGTA